MAILRRMWAVPLFGVRSTAMWEEEEEASGDRQNSSGGFSVSEKYSGRKSD